MAGARRVARGLLGTVLALLGLGTIAVLALFFVGRSDWGRQRILAALLPAVEKQLVGTLRIGALDGDFTHMLVLRDVELSDAEGQLAVRIPYIGLRYNLLALLGRTLHLTAVDLKRAEVHGRMLKDGRLNLAALTQPDESPPGTGPLPIRILVSGIDCELAASFDSGAAGSLSRAAARLRLRGGLHLRPDRRLSVDVDALFLELSAPLQARLTLAGKLALSLLDVAKSLSLDDVALTLATQGAELTRLAPTASLHGPLALDAKLDGTLAALAARLKLSLPRGQAQLQSKLNLIDEKLPWQLALTLDSFDPAALRSGLIASQIDLSLRGEGSGTSGRIELQSLSIKTEKNALRLSGSIAAPVAPPIWQDPLGMQADLGIKLEARELAELSRLGAGLPTLGGSLSGSGEVHLKQRSLRLSTHLRGSELRGPGVAIGRLQLDADTTDLAGKLVLAADNIEAAGQRLLRLALSAAGDRRLVRLNLDGEGPEAVKLKLTLQARPQLIGGGDALAALGAQLTGVVADLEALELQRGGAQLSLTQPAQLRLLKLDTAPSVEVSALELSLGALKLRLDGGYETAGQRLAAKVDADNLDVQELVRLATGTSTAPQSQLALHLELGGSTAAPAGALRLSGHIAPLPGTLPWRVAPELAATLVNRRVRGQLSLRAEAAPTESHSPSVTAHFDCPLGKEGAIELKLDADSALEALRPLLPGTLRELSGAVAAQVSLGGTLRQPQGELKVVLPRWQLSPWHGADTTLSVTYKAYALGAKLASRVLSDDGQPLLRAELTAAAPLRLDIDGTGSKMSLGDQLRSGDGRVELFLHELALPQLLAVAQGTAKKPLLSTGSAELSVQARGPLLKPTVIARVAAKELRGAAGSGLPTAALEAGLRLDYRQDDLGLQLDIDLDRKPLLRGQAAATLAMAPLLADSTAYLSRLPLRAQVDVLPTPLPPGLPLRGSIKAHAELKGTSQEPQLLADAAATGLLFGDWPVGDLSLHASLDAQRLLKAQAKIAQSGAGSLSLDAAVPLPLDPMAEALKLALLAKGFRVDYQVKKGEPAAVRLVRGTLDSNLTVQGAAPQPLLLGSLALRDGQLSAAAVPQLIRDIVVELEAQKDALKLVQAAARAGQGHIRAEGGARLATGTLQSVDLTATVRDFPIAAGAIGLWADTKLKVAGSVSDDTLRVTVHMPYGTLRLPKLMSSSDSDTQALGPLEDLQFVDAAARAAAAAQADAEAERQRAASQPGASSAPPLLPPRTQVAVELPPAFVVTGPEVKTNVQGHIDAELGALSPSGPSVTGEIRTLGGWVEILGRRYQLERAQVSMSGEAPPNPLLNIVLSRKLDDTTIYIVVGGTARKPTITFRSDPATYDQAQIIAMVLSGTRGGSIQQQALGALSGLIVGKLKDSLGKAVPVDVIKLDVGGNDASGANQSSLEVGKYLRDNLYLSYTHRFGSPSTILRILNNDQIALEWYFLPNYQINLMGGDRGVGALNLYWTKRF